MPSEESIQSFNASIEVQPDASVLVTEKIMISVTGKQVKRGIIRVLPYQEEGEYTVQSVRLDGKTEPYSTQRMSSELEIRIGRHQVFLSPGMHEYEIVYRASNVVRFQDEFDELYWNVTGNAWQFPIRLASAQVTLPKGAEIVADGISLYTGRYGETGKDAVAEGNSFFYTTRSLNPGEGFTISVAWNKGVIKQPRKIDFVLGLLWNDGRMAALGCGWLVLLMYYAFMWYAFGRDPKARVVRRFDPPEGLSPAQVSYLQKMRYSEELFSVIVMSLASKGYVRVSQYEGQFVITKTDPKEPGVLPDEERIFLEALFAEQASIVVGTKDAKWIKKAQRAIKESLKKWEHGSLFACNYWANIPSILFCLFLVVEFIQTGNWFFTTLFSLGSMIVVFIFFYSILHNYLHKLCPSVFNFQGIICFWILIIVGCGLGIDAAALTAVLLVPGFIFHSLIRAYTKKGREMMDQVEGFLQYLQVAEKYRVFASDPTDATRIYCSYVPYAAALEMQNEWRNVFQTEVGEAAAVQAERAYGLSFVNDLDRFNSNIHQALHPPSSSSGSSRGSSSGFGGGGFSGGGSGGGGGRGW